MLKKLITMLSISSPFLAFGHDDCADYDHRAFKKDLLPRLLVFSNKSNGVGMAYQEIWFHFKHVGTLDMPASHAPYPISVTFSGGSASGSFAGAIKGGKTYRIKGLTKGRPLKHCQKVEAWIDPYRKPGLQDGCKVYANDYRIILARQQGREGRCRP